MPQIGPKMAFLAESLNLATYWAFSQTRKLKIENGFLRCDQHLELQVLSTHMPYFEDFFFWPHIAPLGFFKLKPHRQNMFFLWEKNGILL